MKAQTQATLPEPARGPLLPLGLDAVERRQAIVTGMIQNRAFILLASVAILAFLFVPYFRTPLNLTQMLTQVSVEGIVSVGITILMVAWGMDLGVGSTLALAGMVYALCQGWGVPVAALLGILSGGLVGLLNGFVVTRFRINFFITTLATMVSIRGLVILVTDGKTLYGSAPGFDWLGSFKVGPLDFPVVAFFGLAVIAYVVLAQTPLGRHWYAIGGNPDAARRAGLHVEALFAGAFVVTGLCAGIAGVLLASRAVSASPGWGQTNTTLMAISATVIGGTSLYGGVGTIQGAVAGILVLGIVRNSLALLGVPPYWEWVVQGLILVSVVLMDVYVTRRRANA